MLFQESMNISVHIRSVKFSIFSTAVKIHKNFDSAKKS